MMGECSYQLSSAHNHWTVMAEATFSRAAFCICEASGCNLQKLKTSSVINSMASIKCIITYEKSMYQLLYLAMVGHALIVYRVSILFA